MILMGGGDPIRGLLQIIFLSKKILYCVVSLRLFICSRSRRSVPEFDIYDSWSGCLWRDTRDSQWVWASVTYRMLCASIAETWLPQTCRESREHPPYSLLYFFFLLWNRTHAMGEPADNVDFPLFVFLLKSRLISLMSLWNRSYNRQVCGLVVWSNRLVCAFRGL